MMTIRSSALDLHYFGTSRLIKEEAALVRTAEDVLKTFANQNEVNVPPNPTYIMNILFFETLPEL